MKRNIRLTFFAILVCLSFAFVAPAFAVEDVEMGACDNSTSGCYAVQDWTPFGVTLGGYASWVSLVNLYNCDNQGVTRICTPLFNAKETYDPNDGSYETGACKTIQITTQKFDGTVVDCLTFEDTAYDGCLTWAPTSLCGDDVPGSGTYIVTIECLETGQIGVMFVTWNGEEITCASGG